MNDCCQLDVELSHLEGILPHIGRGPFPLAYWRQRVNGLLPAVSLASHKIRLVSLKNQLERLEKFPTSASRHA
jgi:hypothetical protein